MRTTEIGVVTMADREALHWAYIVHRCLLGDGQLIPFPPGVEVLVPFDWEAPMEVVCHGEGR